MAGVGISDFGADQINYMAGVTQTLNHTVLPRMLAKVSKRKWEGTDLRFKVHVSRNTGLGYRQDGGTWPSPGKQSYVEAKVLRKFLMGSVEITEGALASFASNKNAAIAVDESELRGLMDNLATFESFMFYQDGTGTVALVGTDISGATIGVTDARLIWDGGEYEIRDAADITVLNDTFTVTSVARALDANGQAAVTIDAALNGTPVATDYIVWPGSVNIAITGLKKLIDDAATTFQNISTTTYPRYTSPVLDNSGTNRALTPTLFRQMLATIVQESGTSPDKTFTVHTNNWQGIEFEELYEGELRLTPTDTVSGLAVASFQSSFGKVNIMPDAMAPYNTMFFVDYDEIERAVQKELDWVRQGGEIFLRSTTSAVRIASAFEACEYLIKQRNKCGKIEDLLETHASSY